MKKKKKHENIKSSINKQIWILVTDEVDLIVFSSLRDSAQVTLCVKIM